MPKRSSESHKGTFGTALIIAGSISFSGAAWLAGNAAYRSGVGSVIMAVTEPVYPVLAREFPEAVWVVCPDQYGFFSEQGAEHLINNLGKTKSILIGPGFGTMETSKKFIEIICSNVKSLPIVVDADGLRLLSQIKNWTKLLPKNSVLTPHPGEMTSLTGLRNRDIQADRVNIAADFAKKWGHVVVLKGAFTVIASPSGETVILPFATSALATAGTGDVLAGMITGFIAQGMNSFEAAYIGAWVHAKAGLAAAKSVGSNAGVIAGDLLLEIPKLLN